MGDGWLELTFVYPRTDRRLPQALKARKIGVAALYLQSPGMTDKYQYRPDPV